MRNSRSLWSRVPRCLRAVLAAAGHGTINICRLTLIHNRPRMPGPQVCSCAELAGAPNPAFLHPESLAALRNPLLAISRLRGSWHREWIFGKAAVLEEQLATAAPLHGGRPAVRCRSRPIGPRPSVQTAQGRGFIESLGAPDLIDPLRKAFLPPGRQSPTFQGRFWRCFENAARPASNRRGGSRRGARRSAVRTAPPGVFWNGSSGMALGPTRLALRVSPGREPHIPLGSPWPRVRRSCLEAYDHQALPPFERSGRNAGGPKMQLSHTPLFQVRPSPWTTVVPPLPTLEIAPD